ncbi:MAG: hypothetical protein IPM97_15840 [Bdellovibrionaceae bacterium]|nr:hypothetical protein [Pseudobdellovibrionaceae bacterium]
MRSQFTPTTNSSNGFSVLLKPWLFLTLRMTLSEGSHQDRSFKKNSFRKLRRIENQRQKEKDHQDALESHRKYQYTGWWNIGFIEEDRATLFKGYEDIKWQWGSQRIDRTKLYTPDDSIKLAYMVFLEISIYRQAFIEKAKWTPAMEVFWRKILPKQFNLENQRPEVGLKEHMKPAIADLESDKPVKASA